MSARYLHQMQSIGRRLSEKTLQMRCDAYQARIKAELLHQTIQRLDRRRFRHDGERGELAATVERTRAQLSELEAINQELSRFAETVAHDLSQPLFGVEAYLDAIEAEACGALSARGRHALEGARAATRLLIGQFHVLLDFARRTSAPLEPEEVDLSASCEALLRERLAREGRAVEYEVDPGMRVRADLNLLRLLLANLIDNAIKFSRSSARPRIRIYQRMQGGSRVFSVADNGAGFDPAHTADMFVPFSRLDLGVEGTGIGLTTAQRVVHRHGGQIWAEGEPGKGATFSFTLAPARAVR